ncbi:MAG: hypothetical protein D6771_01090 [Zetaproteobacteria bacterium]|nr:MAG: hypothetical protein D6771_01090 [Zetaproteobacteria bacterium]
MRARIVEVWDGGAIGGWIASAWRQEPPDSLFTIKGLPASADAMDETVAGSSWRCGAFRVCAARRRKLRRTKPLARPQGVASPCRARPRRATDRNR